MGVNPPNLNTVEPPSNVLSFFLSCFFAEKKNRCRQIDKQLDQAYFFRAKKKKIAWWQVLTHTFFLSYQVVQGKLFVYSEWCSKFSEQSEQSVIAYKALQSLLESSPKIIIPSAQNCGRLQESL